MGVKHKGVFLDWTRVERGFLDPYIDPCRLSEEGKIKLEEAIQGKTGRYFKQTGHALRRRMLPHGIKVVAEKASKSAPWLTPDKPWEQMINEPTVIHEQGRYRCWYYAAPPRKAELEVDGGRVMDVGAAFICYAESVDGINWVKPELGIIPFRGQNNTNIVFAEGNGGGAVFCDVAAPPAERYKYFLFDKLHDAAADAPAMRQYGLYGLVSPDGYHWTKLEKPLIRYFCDTTNIMTRDAATGEYVGYFRSHVSGRSISRSTTKDFKNWPEPETIMYVDSDDRPSLDYYTIGFTLYPDDPSLKIMFPGILHTNDAHVDARMAVSLNGLCFHWVSREPVIDVGSGEDWDSGCIYAMSNLVRFADGKLALPYLGTKLTHEEGWFAGFYKDYDQEKFQIAWAIWDEDRLAGIEAADFGEFWTPPILFDADRIEINARTTRSGSVSVGIWDEEGNRAIAKLSVDDAASFSGNELWTSCKWGSGTTDLSAIKGRKIRLHFSLNCAKVFGYRFVTGV